MSETYSEYVAYMLITQYFMACFPVLESLH